MAASLSTKSATRAALVATLAIASAVLASGCDRGDQLLEAGSCQYTFECAVGEICSGGVCVAAQDRIPVGEGGSGGSGAGGSGGAGGAGGTAGAGGSGGVGGTGGAEEQPRITFAPNDYRRCYDSLECAVFGGNCLIELPLSRPTADGVDRIPLSELDRTLKKGQGICGVPCTNEPRICDSFTVTGPEGQSKASSCQLVYVGDGPYPEGATAFPFPLDTQAMARGVPYASICRPPFENAPAHSPNFCEPCTEAAHCGDGDACWLDRPFTSTPSGACVQRCELQKDCPFGFRCTDVLEDDPFLVGEAGSYCVPVAGTCGRCLDRDGDQRGVGTCGPLDEPFTEVDCDDTNPAAFFDPLRPAHPFPTYCGEFDFNCNGLSDRAEQAGSDAHCEFCGDLCTGPVDNGTRSCSPTDDGHACVAVCEPGFADCNGEVEDGCETELRDGMIWARDRDADGRGNPNERRYFCDGGAPAGWVQNTFDCDDGNPNRYGGGVDDAGLAIPAALEVCDGIDNDCNGLVDDGTVVALDDRGAVAATAGEVCDTGLAGVCAAGRFACEAASPPVAGAPLAAMRCVPDLDPAAAMRSPEVCNGLDDDCDGAVDDGVDWFAEQGDPNPGGPGAPASCVVPGGVGICASGVRQCLADSNGGAAWTCVPNEPRPIDPIGDGIDENCDGIDGDMGDAVFVRPVGGGGTLNGNDSNDGAAQRPVATMARALQLACAAIPAGHSCRDIYVEHGIYSSAAQLTLPTSAAPGDQPYVRIYGGFKATVTCGDDCELIWDRPAGTTSYIVREAPAPNDGLVVDGERMPYGKRYAAIGAVQGGTGPMDLLMDRIEVTVLGPDASHLMPEGASAPAQVGLECPARGCSRLVFSDVSFDVAEALNGSTGSPGAGGTLPDETNDGIPGCVGGETCVDGTSLPYPHPFVPDNWFMNYGYCVDQSIPSGASTDFRRQPAQCADGRTPYGGNSGAVRCYESSSGSVRFRTSGRAGGGSGAGAGGSAASRGGRGSDGAMGRGGSYVATSSGTLTWSGGPSPAWRYQSASSGSSGGGGGGAGGCLLTPGFLTSYKGCNQNHRGGGGAAGGCNGTAGNRGGHGGSSIGMLLVPPASGSLDLQTPGAFIVSTGRAGNGGNGGNGGAGVGGGWGGRGREKTEDANFTGGDGGDGGGGGGGGGGLGGASVGMWRVCTRPGGTLANGCSMSLPPMLLASPDIFLFPGQAGKGGTGGTGGKRGEKMPNMNQRKDNGAQPGQAPGGQNGRDGERIHLYFSGGVL